MIKYPLLVFNFLGIFLMQIFFDDGVIIEDNTPTALQPGETKTVEITINKGEISGFAKLELVLPGGLSATAVDTHGASFTPGSKTKFIWMTLPEEQEFTVSYNLTADANASGNLVVKGTFSYIKDSQRVDYDLQSKLVAIGVAADGLADDTSDSGSETSDSQGDAEQGGAMVCTRYVTEISSTEYLVKLEVSNADLNGFAKIMENVPPGFAVEEDDSDGAIATIETNGIKYVWFEAPETEKFSVSYRIQAMSSVGEPEIDGTFSYVADNSPQEMPVVDGGQGAGGEDLADASSEDMTEEFEDSSEDTADNMMDESEDSNTGSAMNDTAEEMEDTTMSTETDETTTDTAEDIAQEDTSTNQVVEDPEPAQVEEEDVVADNTSNDAVEEQRATTIPEPETGVTYRVQIAAGHNTVGKSYFKKRHNFSENFNIEHHEGWVKYTTGSHGEYKGARDNRERINSRYNFRGPFVTAYNNGERITVQEALMITKQQWYQ